MYPKYFGPPIKILGNYWYEILQKVYNFIPLFVNVRAGEVKASLIFGCLQCAEEEKN